MKRSLRYALAALALGLAAPALAQTATANLAVSATVINNCSISANPIVFGNYDPVAATAVDGAGSVVVTCTASRAWWVGLGAGSGGATAGVSRSMSLGASRLGYELYSDSGRSTVWGNTQPTGVGGTGSGAAQTVPVYGRVAAGQTTVPAGAYADSVVATVNF
ncbi:MAG TPA: spore coat U domain-containing protein [Anaeromyxobacteraceae bacterium]|nr:spore coat U domain-containing protein [Anaeromyxobacteraceae bacterium]